MQKKIVGAKNGAQLIRELDVEYEAEHARQAAEIEGFREEFSLLCQNDRARGEAFDAWDRDWWKRRHCCDRMVLDRERELAEAEYRRGHLLLKEALDQHWKKQLRAEAARRVWSDEWTERMRAAVQQDYAERNAAHARAHAKAQMKHQRELKEFEEDGRWASRTHVACAVLAIAIGVAFGVFLTPYCIADGQCVRYGGYIGGQWFAGNTRHVVLYPVVIYSLAATVAAWGFAYLASVALLACKLYSQQRNVNDNPVT